MNTLRIVLADDHKPVRQGLRKILEERPNWTVVAEAADGREAVCCAERYEPDVAVVDVAMPKDSADVALLQAVNDVSQGNRFSARPSRA